MSETVDLASGLLVRDARPDEFAAVGETTVAAYVADGLLPEAESSYVAELRDAARRARGAELLVAVAPDDTVLGTVTFCLPGSPYAEVCSPGEAEFRMLAVRPGARGKGVGGALVAGCLDRARERGCHTVLLLSLPTLRTAHALYERLGFVRLPERDWRPVPHVTLLCYARTV